MRRSIILATVAAAAGALATAVWAQTPTETPFPSPKIPGVFVASQTFLADGTATNFAARGTTVSFRVFAGAGNTGKVLTDKDVKYAYVKVPGQPNVKLTFKTNGFWVWTGTWTVPADYPLGLVQFAVRFKTTNKQYGNFVQFPVVTSQLTVTRA